MTADPSRSRLDPDVRRYLEQLDREPRTPVWDVSIEVARETDRNEHLAAPKTPVGHIRDFVIPGPQGPIPARLYRPNETVLRETMGQDGNDLLPGAVFLHGGGFVFGDLETHDEAGRRLASGTGAVVVSVDYRLAPEHRFPAGVEDSVAATQWVAENATSLGIDPERIVVVGDSAGGNLAAVVARRLRDQSGPQLRGHAMIYPVTDMRPSSTWASRIECAEGFGLSQATMNWFGEQYLNSIEDTEHPDASPILVEDLGNLPPAFLLTVEFDPLRDEGNAYAQRLIEAGVPTEHHVLHGTIHGVLTNTARFESGETVWRMTNVWIRNALQSGL